MGLHYGPIHEASVDSRRALFLAACSSGGESGKADEVTRDGSNGSNPTSEQLVEKLNKAGICTPDGEDTVHDLKGGWKCTPTGDEDALPIYVWGFTTENRARLGESQYQTETCQALDEVGIQPSGLPYAQGKTWFADAASDSNLPAEIADELGGKIVTTSC